MDNLKSKIKSLLFKLREKFCRAFKRFSSHEKRSPLQWVFTVIGIALCTVLSFLLICNMVIIIKGSASPDMPPSVFGTTPMVVLSGSMSGERDGHIEVGDLVFVNKADPDSLKVGDVIAFMDSGITVTHRIIRVETLSDGDIQWITKGDANNTEDSKPVTSKNLVGIYSFRIPKMGNVAMFLQQPVGMLIVIGIPCLAFIAFDIIRRQRSANRQNQKASEMEAELERLRKIVDTREQDSSTEENGTAYSEPEEYESDESTKE